MSRYYVRMTQTYGMGFIVTAPEGTEQARELADELWEHGSDGDDHEYERIGTEVTSIEPYTGRLPDTRDPSRDWDPATDYLQRNAPWGCYRP